MPSLPLKMCLALKGPLRLLKVQNSIMEGFLYCGANAKILQLLKAEHCQTPVEKGLFKQFFLRGAGMRKLEVKSKADVMELLFAGYILGVRDDRYSSFGGFQRWHYERETNICTSCESHWSDQTKRVHSYNLKKATKILWRNRRSLYIYTKNIPKDKLSKLQIYCEHAVR
jgi:hypothetical protein